MKTDIPEQAQLRANEAELIKRVCNGDREAFYELVQPYERLVYATAISVVKNPADAEEVAQEAVLKAFSNLASSARSQNSALGCCKSPTTKQG